MAYIRQAQGEGRQALQLMERAVEHAKKGKNKRQLLQRGGNKEHIGRIQAAFLPVATTHQDLIDPLAKRELKILHLIAAGLSNPEIADQLIIATGTVARHTNNIFGKLAVRNRTEATLQAKALNLI
ncbi:MAG: LuxR family maltose regulon positive regulatory protein [Cellvibrionaceae bacterium]|jgi:LuxR family maltose regulon positive regulatory protein